MKLLFSWRYARENMLERSAIGWGFTSHWITKWRERKTKLNTNSTLMRQLKCVAYCFQIVIFMFKNITSVNGGAIITGVLCLVTLIGLKQVNERCRNRLKLPIPAELLVVRIITARVYLDRVRGSCKMPQQLLSRRCCQRNTFSFCSIPAFVKKPDVWWSEFHLFLIFGFF